MNHILNYSKNLFDKIDKLWQNQRLLIILLAATLITLPLKYIFGSLACLIFLLVSFFKAKKADFSISGTLLLPILLYVLMFLSLTWTINSKETISGLQKEVLVLLIPLAFSALPKIHKETIDKVLRIYSYAMVGYTIFYLLRAVYKYIIAGKTDVFFYHELVTLELNAIYVSVFASLAMFFFLAKQKSTIDKISFLILALFVFLLSSKNIIMVDLVLIVVYFFFFSNYTRKIKVVTVSGILVVSIASILFIKPVRERFTIEFDTVLVDNSLNNENASISNISIKQAWTKDQFELNNFFPGTALRIFQIRIFKEMLQEESVFFNGFGLDASQEKIKQKIKQHNLHPSYGEFNFHNEYVQIFSELGVFGFLIVVSMLFVSIRKAIISKDFVHITFSVTMIILFLTESFLSRQRGIIFFIILYCVFNASKNSNEQKILK